MLRVCLASCLTALVAIAGCVGRAGDVGGGTPGSAGNGPGVGGAGPGTGGSGTSMGSGGSATAGNGAGPGSGGSATAGNGAGPGTGGGVAGSGAVGSGGAVGIGGAIGTGGAVGTGGVTGTGGAVAIMAPPSVLPDEKACTSSQPGPRMLRRLSGAEFAASIRSLFNDTAAAAPIATVFSDPVILGFQVDANALLVQELNASQLMDNAEAVAAWAASSMSRLTAFGSCSTKDTTCGQKFVKAFGSKAFRTKLADSDPRVARYVALFNAETTYTAAAQTVITAMLQSPHFLYRSELGTGSGGTFTLTPYEVATNLAYLLTGNTPDDTLLAAADQAAAGTLTTAAMLDQQAQRLLAAGDTRSQFAIMTFMSGWLGLDKLYTTAKDGTVYALTDAMRADMATETRSLILEAFNGTGSFGSLLTANHSFLNKNLATFYGLPTGSLGTAFTSVTYTASMQRDPGLLGQASLLIGYSRPDISSPTQRGHMVRSRLLCQDVPPPPANLDTMFKPAATAKTTRQHFETEHSVGVCYACHQLMDDIGYGFEHYDGFGRYRTTENGATIDASGKLISVSATAGSPTFNGLTGAGSLGAYLAASPEVNQCMIRYWAYVAYGASSWAQDACTYAAVRGEAGAASNSLKSTLMALIHAPHFTRRVQDQ